jgi:hypothetical protein
MFNVWSHAGIAGLGEWATIFGQSAASKVRLPFGQTGGPSVLKAMQQHSLKLSTYNPNHPADRWGRPLDTFTPGQAVVNYHPDLHGGVAYGFDTPPPVPTDYALQRGGNLEGLGSITDTISNLWSTHPMYLLGGAALAWYFLMGKHRR